MRLIWYAVLCLAVSALTVPGFGSAKEGADIYKGKCAACHGQDGKGQTPMGKNLKLRDLGSDDVQKQHDSDLKLLIENGKGKMPSYKGKLTDKQMEDVIEFIRSFKTK